MAELLEGVMLICFGFSWPMSVVRNIKAKSAKNMSLGFNLLIVAGYIAGICAKLCMHNYSYVLIVYIINLLFVSANLVIYFINCSYDKKRNNDVCEKNRSNKKAVPAHGGINQ